MPVVPRFFFIFCRRWAERQWWRGMRAGLTNAHHNKVYALTDRHRCGGPGSLRHEWAQVHDVYDGCCTLSTLCSPPAVAPPHQDVLHGVVVARKLDAVHAVQAGQHVGAPHRDGEKQDDADGPCHPAQPGHRVRQAQHACAHHGTEDVCHRRPFCASGQAAVQAHTLPQLAAPPKFTCSRHAHETMDGDAAACQKKTTRL